MGNGNEENTQEYPTFDDARLAVENMNFDMPAEETAAQQVQQPQSEPVQQNTAPNNDLQTNPAQETQNAVQQNEQQPQPAQNPVQETQQIARDAVNIAQNQQSELGQLQAQIQQMMAQNQQLAAQNQNLSKLIEEMNQNNEEQIVNEVMEMPMLDIGSMAFDDEDTIRAKQQDYANRMRDYIKQDIKQEYEPLIAQAQQGIREKEKSNAVSVLSKVPEFADIKEMMPQIERIMASNTIMQSDGIPIEDKLITAYAIAKGVNAINEPPKSAPSTQELMEMYRGNPEFQNMIEQDRINKVKHNQGIPNMSSSSGAINAALNIPKRPKTFEEAGDLVRKMFGEE